MDRGSDGRWTVAVTRVVIRSCIMMIRVGRIERPVGRRCVQMRIVLAVVQVTEIVLQLSGFVVDQLLELCDNLQLLVAQLLGGNQRLLDTRHRPRLLDGRLAARFLVDRTTAGPLLVVIVHVAQMS